ncbi:MAG: hypothetical protein ACI865_001147 [Flavobacteriaceae bacterium]|jgi:hypothetical protein
MTKKYLLLASIFIFVLVASCNRYSKITFSSNKLYKQKEVAENIEEYDVFVHNDEKTYRFENPEMTEGELTGTPSEISANQESFSAEDTLNDIHLYVSNSDGFEPSSSQVLTPEDIESVEMYGKQKDDTGVKVALIILIVIAAVIITVLLILLLVINAAASGSDSGGGSSGCYVATMAYGSYDAPQVLILRSFRDRFLQKSRGGRAFIKWYYAKSPSFVAEHRSKVWLHKVLRAGLNVFVAMLRPFYGK